MRRLKGISVRLGCGLLVLGALGAGRPASAQEAQAPIGQVKATKSQPRLELRRVGTTIRAAVCRRTCDWSAATAWTLEAPFSEVAPTFTALDLGEGRRAAHVVIAAGERRFELVVAAPIDASPGARPATTAAEPHAPVVAFAGETGLTTGEEPDRTGSSVELLPTSNDAVNVVVGNIQEDVTLCGRKALLSPRLLHPQTMTLKAIKLQRLPSAERDAAPTLGVAALSTRVSTNIFTPLVASSGKGSPAALVDNDAETVWTENRGGSGGGEFVVFRAPDSIGITGLTFTAPTHPKADYQPPNAFWVATRDAVFRVDLAKAATDPAAPPSNVDPTSATPPDAASKPAPAGREWYVPLPTPLKTSCLAISLDTAERNDGDVDVGFSEVGATTDVDEARLSLALADLDSGGDQATAAEQLLQDVGRSAFERVQTRYRGYSEAGRMRALNVMDAAPCQHSVGVYVHALNNEGSAEAEHGRAGLLRCRTRAIPALARRLPESASERTRLLTNVLVRLDPVAAVDAMTPLLGGGSRAKRRVLQLAFQAAITQPEAAARARVLLADPKLEPRAGIFLARALGARLVDYVDVAAPRLRQWLTGADFATRYLALAPAAVLAPKDRELQTFLVEALTRAKEPALRTEAARVLRVTTGNTAALVGAIDDGHVRVREAAVVTAGEQSVASARSALHGRLQSDSWPLVRSAAVRALARLPVDRETTRRLADAAEGDAAPSVRRPAIHTLGLQNARSELEVVREAFRDDADPDVRATAATSLGLMCDRTMLGELTSSALKFGNLSASETERLIAKSSLNAVGRLNPPDLERRLAPLMQDGVPQIAQAAARAALAHPEPCGGPQPPSPVR